jgi:hypothetical protein
MSIRSLTCVLLVGAAAVGLTPRAAASVPTPGSILIFPCWDNTPGTLTLLTVTNTNHDPVNGSIDVEFVYINGSNCNEFNRTRTLTATDELTVATFFDHPGPGMGYVYVFAKSHTTGAAVKFDWLIGDALIITGPHSCAFELPPFVFKAGAALAEGANTDLNNNHLRDFDGNEYEPVPDKLEFPSFAGSTSNLFDEIFLINLTGGAQFTAIVDVLLYNDNEEQFSAQVSFRCWDKIHLDQISGAFTNAFLLTTNHSSTEIAGLPDAPEFGWFEIDGDVAFSTATQFTDPAILAARNIIFQNGALVPGATLSNTRSVCVILPFGLGTQTNGSLLSQSLLGN